MRLADQFAEATQCAERTFIAGSWINPVGGHDAAVVSRLSTDDFSDRELSWLFKYVCISAEAGVRPTVDEAVRLARRDGVYLFDIDLTEIILSTRTHHAMIETYAEAVKDFARKRRLASKHLKKIGAILNIEEILNERTQKSRAGNIHRVYQCARRANSKDEMAVAGRHTRRITDADIRTRRNRKIDVDDGHRRARNDRSRLA